MLAVFVDYQQSKAYYNAKITRESVLQIGLNIELRFMIPVSTISEIKALDQRTKAGDLKKGFALMQQASRIIFDLVISEILTLQKQGKESTILILCGKGNNGGDGLLAASYLIEQGYTVKCFLFAHPRELKDEAKMAYEYLLSIKENPCSFVTSLDDLVQLKDFMNVAANSELHCFILDALYGIGYQVDNENTIFKSTSEIINHYQKEKTVIAIDAPSGIDNDTGVFRETPMHAKFSIAMGFPKLGCFFYPARAFIGLMLVGSLNYTNEDIQEALKSRLFFVDNVKNFFPGRALNGSKYDHGVVVNIAGSDTMTGAAILSSKSAFKAGAGLVYLYSSAVDKLHGVCPELILKQINSNTIQEILSDKKVNIISMGSGLGAKHNDLVYELVEKSDRPLILDADAINAFVDNHDKLKHHKADILITPHLGEYKRLFPDDLTADLNPLNIIESIKKRAKEFNISILLKGTPSLIVDPCGEVFIIPFGNSGLATAGTGDVLTGFIAGFLAQSLIRQNKFLANSSLLTQNAILACYLHSRCSELIAPEITEYSIMASDILNNLHRAIKSALN